MSKPRKPRSSKGGPRTVGRLQRVLDAAAEAEIRATLAELHGNVLQSARVLGIHQTSLIRRMHNMGISADRYRR